jgi:hypothetical protein
LSREVDRVLELGLAHARAPRVAPSDRETPGERPRSSVAARHSRRADPAQACDREASPMRARGRPSRADGPRLE